MYEHFFVEKYYTSSTCPSKSPTSAGVRCSQAAVYPTLQMVEPGPRCGRDLPIGRGLLQLHGLILLQDQEAEEDGCHVRASTPLTHCL